MKPISGILKKILIVLADLLILSINYEKVDNVHWIRRLDMLYMGFKIPQTCFIIVYFYKKFLITGNLINLIKENAG